MLNYIFKGLCHQLRANLLPLVRFSDLHLRFKQSLTDLSGLASYNDYVADYSIRFRLAWFGPKREYSVGPIDGRRVH